MPETDPSTQSPSTQTWPSATTREVRSHRALDGADAPTEILVLPPTPRRALTPRRLLVLASVCAAVLLGATVAAFAALGSGTRPPTSAAPVDGPLRVPAGTLAATTAPATTAASAAAAPQRPPSRRASPSTASAAATTSAPSRTGGAATSPATGDKATGAPPAGLAPDPPTARTGVIRGQTGLCLDLNGGVAVEFNHVQVFTCNQTSAQTWTLATDGTLRVIGMCALIAGDDTVHITACDGRTTAQWKVSGQSLINAANGKCLTDPSGGAKSGAGVVVTACAGRANQHWSLP
jgi:ricin-type beta-trefoil lectin protein